MSRSYYATPIATELEARDRCDVDPRHIEGYMRLAHPTLDGLSLSEFRGEVAVGIACVDEGGTEAAERNARSFGL